jgi:hypothetical protein
MKEIKIGGLYEYPYPVRIYNQILVAAQDGETTGF